jgi:zinc protease
LTPRPPARVPAFSLMLSVLAALALAPQAQAQTPGQTTAVPPIAYHLRVLPNGLKMFSVLDRTTPNVTVQMWYGVGSKDDPAGRSGFAHLFEHLMFKGARDMPPEYLDRLTEDVGGFNNASTADDYTEYHEVVPANHLERLLWAEAERLGGLVVDQADFTSERQVVEEELRQRVLADPYGRLFQLNLAEASFAVHPYHRPGIGSISDLDAASLADVRAFHAVYYRPDNANLIVIGNFDPAGLDAWVDEYFAPIPRPAAPLPRVTAVEPARTGVKHYDAYGPTVPLPAVVLTFAAPSAASPDAAALRVLDALLSAGKSSRLYDSLVYRQQLAQSVFSDPDLRQQPGLFAVGAVMAAGKTPDQGEAALRAELKRLRDAPVSTAELAAAKNQLIAATLRDRETLEGRGADLGQAITVEGDPARVNRDIADLARITPAQVQAAARRYLVDDRRVVIAYRPEAERPAGQADALTQESPLVAAAPLIPPAVIPQTTLAAEGERQAPPAPSKPLSTIAPAPVEITLANGLRVIVARTSDLPIVTAQLTVRGGAAYDPLGLAGLSDLTADLLPQGAGEGAGARSAAQIAAQVESLGGTLGAQTGYDGASVILGSLAATLPQALPILADVVRRPTFAESELDLARRQKLDELTVALQEPGALARLVLAPTVFGSGPYGLPAAGVEASLKRITRADVMAQHQRLYRPDNAVLVLTGDIDPATGFALARQAFGDWKRPDAPAPPPPRPAPAGPARVVVVDLPGAGQAAVLVGGRSIGREDAAYYDVEVANAVLGGGYSARLNEEVRVKRGLSYGAGSAVVERRGVGLFSAAAQTRNDAAPEVADLMLRQIRSLGAAPAPQSELDARKASLIGEFGRAAATSAGLASLLSADALYGVDLGESARYADAVGAVGGDRARLAAARLVDSAQAQVVVVGDAKLFIDQLRKTFPTAEVISAQTLDLEQPSLRKPAG